MSITKITMRGSSENFNSETIDDIIFSNVTRGQLAWQDIKGGVLSWRIWLLLAYQDIKLRYNRSILGPFWITISMAVTVYSMGYLYSHLFHMKIGEYFPYLVTGMLGWSLISTNITEMVDTFTSNDGLLKQIKLPYSLYLHRLAAKNIIIFFHNILVFLPVMIIFRKQLTIDYHLLFLIPGLGIIYFNTVCYGLVFAMIGARYRDISQLIKSLIQVIFFLTPIMWKPDILPLNKQFIAYLNPAYSFLELIRAPLLGYSLTISNICIITLTSLTGYCLAYFIFVPRRARIIYWL